jgi:hypothetical protein
MRQDPMTGEQIVRTATEILMAMKFRPITPHCVGVWDVERGPNPVIVIQHREAGVDVTVPIPMAGIVVGYVFEGIHIRRLVYRGEPVHPAIATVK